MLQSGVLPLKAEERGPEKSEKASQGWCQGRGVNVTGLGTRRKVRERIERGSPGRREESSKVRGGGPTP